MPKAGKILKCEEFLTEIQRMWNVKAKVIPVIIEVTGTIPKSLRQYPSNALGKHLINPINAKLNPICHSLALLGVHHILHVSRIRAKELPKKKKKQPYRELNTYYKKC
jgi:hypothetical protein